MLSSTKVGYNSTTFIDYIWTNELKNKLGRMVVVLTEVSDHFAIFIFLISWTMNRNIAQEKRN